MLELLPSTSNSIQVFPDIQLAVRANIMALDLSNQQFTPSQPSTSYMDGINNRHRQHSNAPEEKRARGSSPPQFDSDWEDEDVPASVAGGNWGKKNLRGARWVRKGKADAWGPGRGEWEVCPLALSHLNSMLDADEVPTLRMKSVPERG